MRSSRAPRRPARRGEEGFTLIEMVIVLIVLPLIMGGITAVIITSLQDQSGVQAKISDSADAAVSSAFYVRDIESSVDVTTDSTTSTAPPQCSTTGLTGSSKLVLGVELSGGAVVSYYADTLSSGGTTELVRIYCGATQSREILSHDYNSASSSPSVTCITPPPQNVPTGVTCSSSTIAAGWTPTYLVSNVSLNVTQGCPSTGTPCSAYQYSLTADPVSGVPIPNETQNPGVLTLRASGNDIQFSSSNGAVCASGPILLNSGYGKGTAITTAEGSDSVTSSSSCGSTASATGIEVYDCSNAPTLQGQACTDNPVGAGVAASPSPVSTTVVNDPWQNYLSQYPVAAVTSPAYSSSSVSGSNSGCQSTGSGKYLCSPGLYSNGLTIPDGVTVTFESGSPNYQFDQSLTVGNDDTVFFSTDHYSFENGLTMNGTGSALCAGPGTGPCAGAPSGGVFFYVAGGQVDFGSVSWLDFLGKADVVQLSPITNTSDPYHNILFWQSQSDDDALSIVGYNTASNNYGGNIGGGGLGTIYAPDSPVQVYGLGFTLATGNLVANSLEVFTAGSFGGTTLDVE